MSAYYNENDKYAAQWLRNLIAAGHLPDGVVDDRSIEDVCADELREFTQCHFFAGIGGWPYALRLAGVPDDVPVWTGSCPCQPFSTAGKQRGKQDERHLWPVWYKLIDKCRPTIVFGEQVASSIALEWLDDVFDGLENAGYACAAANLCAASVGAPHIRQRLYWTGISMADTRSIRPSWRLFRGQDAQREMEHRQAGRNGTVSNPWANPEWIECRDGKARPTESTAQCMAYGVSAAMVFLCAFNEEKRRIINAAQTTGIGDEVLRTMRRGVSAQAIWRAIGRCVGFHTASILFAILREQPWELGDVVDREAQGIKETPRADMRGLRHETPYAACSSQGWELHEQQFRQFADVMSKLSQENAHFDEEMRRLTIATPSPTATNILCRERRLRAYGNAIVPQVAAEFIRAVF